MTAWTKSDCSGPQKASIWLHDGAKYQVSAINAVSCSDWGRISVEFTSTGTHTIWIHLVDSSRTGVLYWDDIAISEL